MYANRARLTAGELMLRFSELEALTRAPMADGNLKMAEGLAMYVARSAPNGQIANLAMQVMSELIQIRSQPEADGSLEKALSQLETALRGANAPSAGAVAARAAETDRGDDPARAGRGNAGRIPDRLCRLRRAGLRAGPRVPA